MIAGAEQTQVEKKNILNQENSIFGIPKNTVMLQKSHSTHPQIMYSFSGISILVCFKNILTCYPLKKNVGNSCR